MQEGSTPVSESPVRKLSTPGRIMVLTFALAFLIRLLYLLFYRDSLFFSHLAVDAVWHDEWAWEWAQGSWDSGGRAFFRAPLYPFWLSLIYRGFGHSFLVVRLIQALIGAGTAAALAGAGTRLVDRRTGLIIGIVAALYGPVIFFDGELLIPNLLLSLLSWALFSLSRNRGARSVLLAAFLIGVAGVARPNSLVLLLIPGIWIWKQRDPGHPVMIRRWVGILGFGLLPALGVSAVNLGLENARVFVASQGGVNFYAGNHSRASGRSVEIPELGDLVSWREFVDRSHAVAEAGTGRRLDSGEASRWWFRRGMGWILSHPGEVVRLYGRKLYYLVNANEIPSNRDMYTERPGPLKWLLWRAPFLAFPWGLVFPLAVIGWVGAWRETRFRFWALSLGLWVLFYGLTILPFFVTARFRMGLIPPLLILAGFALARLRNLLRGWVPVLGVLALVVVNSNLAQVRQGNPAQELARRGEALLEQGRLEEGIGVLEQAHEMEPTAVTTVYMPAEGYARVGRTDKAIRLYRRVINSRPDDPDLRFNLGVMFLQKQDFENASNAFRTAVRMRPEDGRTWINLGVAYEGRRLISSAMEAFEKGVERIPREELGYLRLADLLIAEEDLERAEAVLKSGVTNVPDSYELVYRLALVHARSGKTGEAMRRVRDALRQRPGDPKAQKLKSWLENQKP